MIQSDILKIAIDNDNALSINEKYRAKFSVSMQNADAIDREEALRCDYADWIRDLAVASIQSLTECRKMCIHQQAEMQRQQCSQKRKSGE